MLSRYFLFQIANLLVTISAGSAQKYLQSALYGTPNDVAKLLTEGALRAPQGQSQGQGRSERGREHGVRTEEGAASKVLENDWKPWMDVEGDCIAYSWVGVLGCWWRAGFALLGAYFIEWIIIKLLFGLAWELSRLWPALQWGLALVFSDRRQWTARSLRGSYLTEPFLMQGWVYPSLLSVWVILAAYYVITPIIAPFALAFFLCSELVFKHQVLFVYTTKAEGGGLLWLLVFDRLMAGLVFAHVLLMAFFVVSAGYSQGFVTFCLIAADIVFWLYCHQAFASAALVLPLDRAASKDHRHCPADVDAHFSRTAFEQPHLRARAVLPERELAPELHAPHSDGNSPPRSPAAVFFGSSDPPAEPDTEEQRPATKEGTQPIPTLPIIRPSATNSRGLLPLVSARTHACAPPTPPAAPDQQATPVVHGWTPAQDRAAGTVAAAAARDS